LEGGWAGLKKLEDLITEKSPKMTGACMDADDKNSSPGCRWESDGCGRRPGQPGRKWLGTFKHDLQDINLIWHDSEEFVANECKWR